MRLARGEISPEDYRILLAQLDGPDHDMNARQMDIHAPRSRTNPSDDALAEFGWSERANRALMDFGFTIMPDGVVLKSRTDNRGRKSADIIGDVRKGWFRWGPALGALFAFYLFVIVVTGIAAWLFGFDINRLPSVVRTLLAWTPLVLWALWLSSVRSDFKEFEAARNSVLRDLK